MGERRVEQWCRQSRVGLHIVGSLGYFGDHHVGFALGDERRNLLVVGVYDEGRVGEVLAGELLVEAARVDHDAHFGSVDVLERAEP